MQVTIKSTKESIEDYQFIKTIVTVGNMSYEIHQSMREGASFSIVWKRNNKQSPAAIAYGTARMGKTFWTWKEIAGNYAKLRPIIDQVRESHESAKKPPSNAVQVPVPKMFKQKPVITAPGWRKINLNEKASFLAAAVMCEN